MATPRQDREIGLVRSEDPKTGERFSKYDPAFAIEIVERIANGETLTRITKRGEGMPHINTVRRWLTLYPEFKQAFNAARELSAHAMEERAIDVAGDTLASPGDAQKVRAAALLIDQLRWSAARRNPKEFSDKSALNLVVPVNITSSLDLGGGNVAEVQDVYKLSAQPREVEEGQFTEVPKEEEKGEGENEGVDEPTAVPKKPKQLLARPKRKTRKRVLKPRIPMDAETDLSVRKREQAQANEYDRRYYHARKGAQA